MLTRSKPGWEMPESQATSESIFRNRRRLVKSLAAGPILLAGGAVGFGAVAARAAESDPLGEPLSGGP